MPPNLPKSGPSEIPSEKGEGERETVQAGSREARDELLEAIQTHNLFKGFEYQAGKEKDYCDQLVARIATLLSFPEYEALRSKIIAGGKTQEEALQEFAVSYVDRLKASKEGSEQPVTDQEYQTFHGMFGKGLEMVAGEEDPNKRDEKLRASYNGDGFMGLVLGTVGIGRGAAWLNSFEADSIPGKIVAALRGLFHSFFEKYASKFGIKLDGLKSAAVLEKLKIDGLKDKQIRLNEELIVPDRDLQVAGLIPGANFSIGAFFSFEAGRAYPNVKIPKGTKIPAGSYLKNAVLLEKEPT